MCDYEFAFIDGKPVPVMLSPSKAVILFPQGLAGLREDHRHPAMAARWANRSAPDVFNLLVFPNAEGVILLEPRVHYTLQEWVLDHHNHDQSLALIQPVYPMPLGMREEGLQGWPPAFVGEVNSMNTHAMNMQSAAATVGGFVVEGAMEDNSVSVPVPPSHQDVATQPVPQHTNAHATPHSGEGNGRQQHPSAAQTAAVTASGSDASAKNHRSTVVHKVWTDSIVSSGLTFARPAVAAAAGGAEGTSSAAMFAGGDGMDDAPANPSQVTFVEEEGPSMGCLMGDLQLTASDRSVAQHADMMEGPPQVPLSQKREGKLIQDRVHEHIFLPLLAMKIVDTPEFQRLRGLKQLGTTVFLYPGATHTRFEHCIGVAHLASQMVRHLAQRQPELRITDADIMCVTIAGLCHDIGHGPFSHLFEQVVNRIRMGEYEQHSSCAGPTSSARSGTRGLSQSRRPQQTPSGPRKKWHHEDMSLRLLRSILSRINLPEYGLNDADARFIEICITGLPPRQSWPDDIGRPEHKRFLLDIVANKRHGIDVDKLDYFLRDSLGVYGRAAVDVHFPRLLSASRVLPFDGQFQICYEEKMALNLGDIFAVRAKLHKYAYQHRIVKIIDYMVSDALAAADAFFLVRDSTGKLIRISECVDDEEAFCRLGDWILTSISSQHDKNLRASQSIIDRITRRDLYTIAGTATFAMHKIGLTEERVKDDIIDIILSEDPTAFIPSMTEDEVVRKLQDVIIVCFTTITYGSSDDHGRPDDPINSVTFFNPKNVAAGAFKLPKNRMSPLFSPSEYSEMSMMVMLREDDYVTVVAGACEKWKSRNQRFLTVAVPSTNARSSPVRRQVSMPPSTPRKKRARADDTMSFSQKSAQQDSTGQRKSGAAPPPTMKLH